MNYKDHSNVIYNVEPIGRKLFNISSEKNVGSLQVYYSGTATIMSMLPLQYSLSHYLWQWNLLLRLPRFFLIPGRQPTEHTILYFGQPTITFDIEI